MHTITVGKTRMTVDANGAWVTELTDENGAILFPRSELKTQSGEVKVRGGCHVCVPNFGPDASKKLPQHGFGRTGEWIVQAETEYSLVLALEPTDIEYHRMQTVLTYTLAERSLTMELSLFNDTSEALRVAPAFHPYFATASAATIGLNDETLSVDDYAVMKTVDGTVMTAEINGRTLTLSSNELTTWALWSDRLAEYFCIEPTLGGYRFENASPQEDELLQANGHASYTFEITW